MVNPWQAYRDRIPNPSGRWFFVPTPAQIDQAQAELGLVLPESYRQFVLAFGRGMLSVHEEDRSETYYVAVPGAGHDWPSDCNPQALTGRLAEMYLPDAETAARSKPEDRIRAERLICFCFGEWDGTFWGWDPLEVTDPEAHEYAIYKVRESRETVFRMNRAASSFTEFVREVLFEGRFEEFASWTPSEPMPVADDLDEDDEDLDDEVMEARAVAEAEAEERAEEEQLKRFRIGFWPV